MKKFTLLFAIFLFLTISSTALALYPQHLNDDNNFVLIDGHMGTAWYIDRSSLVAQRYDPPYYILAFNVITAVSAYDNERDFANGGRGKITNVRTMRYFYNWKQDSMYYDTNGHDNWKYVDPNPDLPLSSTRVIRPAGEMGFAIAYDLRFYGSVPRYSKVLNKKIYIFDDNFYKPLKAN